MLSIRSLKRIGNFSFAGMLALSLGACQSEKEDSTDAAEQTPQQGQQQASKEGDAQTQVYRVRGLVRGHDFERDSVTLEHEEIPGYMQAMVMPFNLGPEVDRDLLQVGAAIEFDFNVRDRSSWISQVELIDQSELSLATVAPGSPGAARAKRVREGDHLPALKLSNQLGQDFTADDLKGRYTLLTFIFTRCPVPDFCPLMSSNFAEIAAAIQENDHDNQVRLLSITIDPEFDTPDVLAEYAEGYPLDPELWWFATGEPSEIEQLTQAFAVHTELQSGVLEHGLCTALINPSGEIIEIWRGNAWKPTEVLATLYGKLEATPSQ